MKISKVNTSSFAIAADAELKVKQTTDSLSRGSTSATLEGRYAPLGKFKVVRRESVASGSVKFLAIKKTIYEENSNQMYVNLANARLLYVSGKSRYGIELNELEFFDRLLSLPSKTLSALGYLIEHGSTKKDEIDAENLDELITHGLVEEYRYERNIFVHYVLREVGDMVGGIPEADKDLIRPAYSIPRFKDPRYNLGNYLEADDSIEGTFTRDTVKYSQEQMAGILATLFRCKVDMIEIVYIPYYQHSIIKTGTSERNHYVLACPKNWRRYVYQNPLKLNPISLYSMEVGAKIVPLEGEVVTFKDVADLKNAKDEIMRKIIQPLKGTPGTGGLARMLGGGILFYGPPGCGKTYLAKATVGEVGLSFITGNLEDIMSEGADMAAKKLHDIFENARSAAPCVLFFDEIDAIASRRDLYGSTSVVNQLLTEMDGIQGLGKDILIIGATNMPWLIDPALLRSGRFSEQIYIRPPDYDSRADMFDIYIKKYADIASGISARELASLTDYYSASDIKTIVDRAAIFASEATSRGKDRKTKIQQWHLIQAIKERKPSLIPWFKFAEKQMEIEGAKETYPELWRDIQAYNKNIQQAQAELTTPSNLEKMIQDWKEEDKRAL
jgi:AAA+ superfamily predicted ATPase